jgi:Trk-type K+ transport system membrane component
MVPEVNRKAMRSGRAAAALARVGAISSTARRIVAIAAEQILRRLVIFISSLRIRSAPPSKVVDSSFVTSTSINSYAFFCSPASTRAGVNGASRKRTPTASKIALAMAAAIGALDGSPIFIP